MDSSDRILDEIANDLMVICTDAYSEIDPEAVVKRMSVYETLISPGKVTQKINEHDIDLVNNLSQRSTSVLQPQDFSERLDKLSTMQRLRLQKLEHEILAKLLNRNGDVSVMMSQKSAVEDVLVKQNEDLRALNEQDETRKVAATMLWHLASGLRNSLDDDIPDDLLPEVESHKYDLP